MRALRIIGIIIWYLNSISTSLAITPPMDTQLLELPPPPPITAASYIVIDADNDFIISSKNPSQRRSPASLTKIMTLYVVFQAIEQGRIKMSDQVKISTNAWQQPGSKMFIEPRKKVSVKELIQGVIVASGNDAAYALAEHVAGDANVFVTMMNITAKRLGLQNTHFASVNGLPHPNQYTTAIDLAKIAQATQHNFPQYYKLYSDKKITYNKITQTNRNRLLWADIGVDGMKTGYTDKAGYCLIASAKQQDMRIIAITLGDTSIKQRNQDTKALLSYGFRFFTHAKPAQANQTWAVRTYGNQNKYSNYKIPKNLTITVPNEKHQEIKTEITIPEYISTPVQANSKLGIATFKLNNQTISQSPLVATTDNPPGNLWRQWYDKFAYQLQHIKLRH